MSLYKAIDDDDSKRITTIGSKNKSSLNTVSLTGTTPLLYAIEHGSKNAYRALLENGANPNKLNSFGWCATLEAAGNPDVFWLREALKNGGDPNFDNHASPQRRLTTLMRSANDDCLENTTLLINEYDADVNYLCGNTDVLIDATGRNNFKTVLLLLESGSDYHRKTGRYTSFAATIHHMSPKNFLIEKRRNEFIAVTEWLKAHGVEWDKPVPDGDTWVYPK